MPKISFKSGVLATIILVFLAFVAWPLTYDQFGEGSKLLRNTLLNSKSFKEHCGTVSTFFIIPWKLSLDDSDKKGNLELAYWFNCNENMASVIGNFHHTGGNWIIDTLEIRSIQGIYSVKEQSGTDH